MAQMKNATFAEDMATLREMPAQAKAWAENTLEYYKLTAIEKVATTAGAVVGKAAAAIVGIIALFFLSIAASIGLGRLTGDVGWGFLIIGGLYAILAVIFFSVRGNFVEAPVTNALITSLTASDDEDPTPKTSDLRMAADNPATK